MSSRWTTLPKKFSTRRHRPNKTKSTHLSIALKPRTISKTMRIKTMKLFIIHLHKRIRSISASRSRNWQACPTQRPTSKRKSSKHSKDSSRLNTRMTFWCQRQVCSRDASRIVPSKTMSNLIQSSSNFMQVQWVASHWTSRQLVLKVRRGKIAVWPSPVVWCLWIILMTVVLRCYQSPRRSSARFMAQPSQSTSCKICTS